MSKSLLRQQIETAAPTGDLGWDKESAAMELLLTAISGVTLGASNAAANAGSDAGKAISVQGVTGGKAVPVTLAAAVTAAIGTTADAAWNGTNATASIVSLLKTIALNTTPA